MNFSERLKKLRKERGLSQESLASAADIPRGSIAHYERGVKRLPEYDRLFKLADYFGVSVDYLIGRSDYRKYTKDELDFVDDSQELSVQELQEKYKLTLDGKPATKEELEGAIAFIRSLRGIGKDEKK
ncbi:helix-turn-helix domain-containing protein [Halobacillus salinus]|uniref:helix-turn-helix domain-containing protein n=1 Tax=Halobacillus salinus TaxID=192814 RepID=UPI0009A637B6|nr:helix-turn-helix transcriptional regulator [Halobacillus salinus]